MKQAALAIAACALLPVLAGATAHEQTFWTLSTGQLVSARATPNPYGLPPVYFGSPARCLGPIYAFDALGRCRRIRPFPPRPIVHKLVPPKVVHPIR